MEDDDTTVNGFCLNCWCNEAQAAADAKVLGFEEQFRAGIYSCCQIVQWADEQWLAWLEAANQDRTANEGLTQSPWARDSEPELFRAHLGNSRFKQGWFHDLRR